MVALGDERWAGSPRQRGTAGQEGRPSGSRIAPGGQARRIRRGLASSRATVMAEVSVLGDPSVCGATESSPVRASCCVSAMGQPCPGRPLGNSLDRVVRLQGVRSRSRMRRSRRGCGAERCGERVPELQWCGRGRVHAEPIDEAVEAGPHGRPHLVGLHDHRERAQHRPPVLAGGRPTVRATRRPAPPGRAVRAPAGRPGCCRRRR